MGACRLKRAHERLLRRLRRDVDDQDDDDCDDNEYGGNHHNHDEDDMLQRLVQLHMYELSVSAIYLHRISLIEP